MNDSALHRPIVVIPAKAGIQESRAIGLWIPAFAGMTLWEVVTVR